MTAITIGIRESHAPRKVLCLVCGSGLSRNETCQRIDVQGAPWATGWACPSHPPEAIRASCGEYLRQAARRRKAERERDHVYLYLVPRADGTLDRAEWSGSLDDPGQEALVRDALRSIRDSGERITGDPPP